MGDEVVETPVAEEEVVVFVADADAELVEYAADDLDVSAAAVAAAVVAVVAVVEQHR